MLSKNHVWTWRPGTDLIPLTVDESAALDHGLVAGGVSDPEKAEQILVHYHVELDSVNLPSRDPPADLRGF